MSKSETQLTLHECQYCGDEKETVVCVTDYRPDNYPIYACDDCHLSTCPMAPNCREGVGQPAWNMWKAESYKELEALFTQALTSLKGEMEKKKVPNGTECNCCDECSNSVPWETGVNAGISECQRLIDGIMK